jgi:hypothetical protein
VISETYCDDCMEVEAEFEAVNGQGHFCARCLSEARAKAWVPKGAEFRAIRKTN